MGLSDSRFLELQKTYLQTRKLTDKPICKFLDFDDFKFSGDTQYPGSRMRVVHDAKMGINEVLNWTNHFASSIADLTAWSRVLTLAKDKNEEFSILVEIISPIAFQTLSFPAAIRGKIVFVCCKAIRDSFNVKKSSGKPFSDHELTERVLTRQFMPHPEVQDLKRELDFLIGKLSAIDGDSFREATLNYRNRANHQITPYLEIGERFAFAAINEPGIEGFTFGVEKAIAISGLINPLSEQHIYSCDGVKALWSILLRLRRFWAASVA